MGLEVLSSLQLPRMGLKMFSQGCGGPWQRATPFSDPSLKSAQGHVRAGGCRKADAGGR